MTFSPKVWGDALRRLQEEIPDFAYDAWIAPLAVKLAGDRVVLGCQTSFHRDRIQLHYADTIRRCWDRARAIDAGDRAGTDAVFEESDTERASSIRILTLSDFAAEPGHLIESLADGVAAQAPVSSSMRRVEAVARETEGVQLKTALGGDTGHSVVHSSLGTRPVSLPPSSSPSADPPAGRSIPARSTASSEPTGRPPVLSAVPEPPARKRAQRTRRDTHQAEPRSGQELKLDGEPAQQELPFSFESFVVGPCNALAREAALALARQRQRSLNQLYLGGDSGMGKTHLARATAFEARRHARSFAPTGPSAGRGRSAGSAVVYTSAEQFTSEFVSAVRNGRSEEFQKRYRAPIGLLVVEDIQFFSGRAKTQLELFHTVQHVLDAGGRVLLTGDRTPRDLVGLDDRMRAQVGRGFVAELDTPDALVRRHILRSKAAAGGFHLPADCLDLLVEASEGSVRDVESVLIQVVTTASLLGRSIDLELTRDAVNLKSGAHSVLAPRKLEVREIVRIVSAFFGKRPEALASRSRRRDVLVPRQLAMYLAHRYTDASFTEIGRALGRDHPSVRNAVTRIERLVLENAPVRYQVEALSERIDQTIANDQVDRERP